MSGKIPLLDLDVQHASLRPKLEEAITRVIDSGQFVGGWELSHFEDEFAAYCGTEHCVGVSSGTQALALGLKAAGIGPGDEVITTTFTFIATAEAILEAGATPVFVDANAETGVMEAHAVESAIGERTAAIVVVHLYGQPGDMNAFRELANRKKLLLVEDAAQAHGSYWDGRRGGSFGDFAAFSFYPGKNLGAMGDAGALTTDDPGLAGSVAALRDHGRAEKHIHESIGTNARLDTLQAAVLRVKLPHLDDWNRARRRHASYYDDAFAGLESIEPIQVVPAAVSSYHQYVVKLPDRDQTAMRLRDLGIMTGIHYPIPVHRQPALAGLSEDRALPQADRLAETVLSIPVFPELTSEMCGRIVEGLREASWATS